MTLARWRHPKTGECRIYVNGLPRAFHGKAYFTGKGCRKELCRFVYSGDSMDGLEAEFCVREAFPGLQSRGFEYHKAFLVKNSN